VYDSGFGIGSFRQTTKQTKQQGSRMMAADSLPSWLWLFVLLTVSLSGFTPLLAVSTKELWRENGQLVVWRAIHSRQTLLLVVVVVRCGTNWRRDRTTGTSYHVLGAQSNNMGLYLKNGQARQPRSSSSFIIINNPAGAADPYRTSSWATRLRPILLQVRRKSIWRAARTLLPSRSSPTTTTITTVPPGEDDSPKSQISRHNSKQQQAAIILLLTSRRKCLPRSLILDLQKYVLGKMNTATAHLFRV
jgi:hypothetical protein